ncbi:hypothetical protein [Roseospira visakhapatnamensis]|uniref:DNA-binding PadR family transcriptional regulator n=1 Tax=Roseospira visakhapatnamensis TaxID=390880 RepID=A0A7W6WB57_9PROT|nr:hypothetical protein [Roseospira visakhapatnamensis]MBB4267709.1 DNA-binding PadR family transcriptional regulator [Roseospira visakhapatnamensis]
MTEDEKQAAITRAGAYAIADWLETRGALGRPIRSLTMGELERMAGAAISAGILARAEVAWRIGDDAEMARLLVG